MFGCPPRRGRGRFRRATGASVALLLCVPLIGALASAGGTVPAPPQATRSAADPSVGVLFASAVATTHECTASVLAGGHGLLLTAAHCLTGTGAGMRFIPGYDGTTTNADPFGVWTVTAAWVPAEWMSAQQPAHDIALLRVADQPVAGRVQSINEVTGGHAVSVMGWLFDDLWGSSLGPVTVVAYNAGIGDSPIACTTGGATDPVPASFLCGGYSGGTSGAPWLQKDPTSGRSQLVGLIGGEHQGGCTDDESFSPDFDDELLVLLSRAELDLPGDDVPAAGSDGC